MTGNLSSIRTMVVVWASIAILVFLAAVSFFVLINLATDSRSVELEESIVGKAFLFAKAQFLLLPLHFVALIWLSIGWRRAQRPLISVWFLGIWIYSLVEISIVGLGAYSLLFVLSPG